MIYPLKSLDKDKVLPDKKELFGLECPGGGMNAYQTGYNTRCAEEDEIALEIAVEEIQKMIIESRINEAHWTQMKMASYLLAQAIAQQPKCFKLTRTNAK